MICNVLGRRKGLVWCLQWLAKILLITMYKPHVTIIKDPDAPVREQKPLSDLDMVKTID